VSGNGHVDLRLCFLVGLCVATWLRRYPSLLLWVRDKIGRQ